MIDYNPKAWFTFIFHIHKGDTVRKLSPMFLGLSIYSAVIAFLEKDVLHLTIDNQLKNIVIVHTLLGFVISTLLVFRTNTAYDRWWEGRKHWGALVNNSRNLSIKLQAILPASNTASREFFRLMIPNYAFSLKNHLRMNFIGGELEHVEGFKIDTNKHVPNQVAAAILAHIHELYRQQQLSGEQLLSINPELQAFTEICGACERIRNTPIPFSYSVFIKKFIFFYVMTLPVGYVFTLGYLIIPVVVFVFYVLASLELIAEEIEDPFGFDANDLPTDTISANIRKHVAEIL
jgi:ion channel-forming bestrophin family protein